MKIYLIIGNTGEYDDYVEWAVCACTNLKFAEERKMQIDMWRVKILNIY